jgi:hypothetical protein
MVESDGGALGSCSLALLFRAAAAPVCYESLLCGRWRLLRRGRMLRWEEVAGANVWSCCGACPCKSRRGQRGFKYVGNGGTSNLTARSKS